jgi:putative membrane protein
MLVDWALASLHHLAVFSLAAILAGEIAMTAGTLDDRTILRLARIDSWYGLMAGLALAAGVARVFLGAKGADYYLVNAFFWIKMALFVAVGLLSVMPTFTLIAWRRGVRADASFRPAHHSVAALRRALYVEACLFGLIPISAAAMARGYGV